MSDNPSGFPYAVEVLDKNGVVLGDGPLVNVLYVEQTECLDQAGEVKVGVPATDPRALALVQNERLMRIRTAEGAWPPATIRSRSLRPGAQPTYDVSGPDLIAELTEYTTGLARNYDDIAFGTVILDLVAETTNPIWDVLVTERSFETITHRFDGESLLAAVLFVTGRMDAHLRYDTGVGAPLRGLLVDAFGDDCGLRLINVPHHLVAQESNTDIELLTSLELVEESTRIVNWLVPLGSGDGKGQLTLANVDSTHGGGVSGPYEVWVMAGIHRGSSMGVTGTAGSNELTVPTVADFAVDDPVYIGKTSFGVALRGDSEVNEIASIVGSVLYLKAPLKNSYGSPAPSRAVCHAWPMYYIRDNTSILSIGQHELVNVWRDITPIDNSDAAVEAAADCLYDVACAFLRKNKLSCVTYKATANWLPWSVRSGDQIRLVYTGVVMRDKVAYSYLDVDDLYTITKITRRINADGSTQAAIEISSVDKSTLDNIGVVVHALQTIGDWELRTQNYPACIQDTQSGILHATAPCYHFVPVVFSSNGFVIGMALERATLTFKTDVLTYTDADYNVVNDTVYPVGIHLYLRDVTGAEVDYTTILGGPWGTSSASVEVTVDVTQLLRNNTGLGLKQFHKFRLACTSSRGRVETTLRMALTSQSFVRG